MASSEKWFLKELVKEMQECEISKFFWKIKRLSVI